MAGALTERLVKVTTEDCDNVISSPVPDITIPNETIPEFVWKNVDRYSNLKAVTCGVSGRSYNYKEARLASRKFGGALLQIGLRPGHVLAIMLPNIPEYAFIVLGALEAGIVVTAINHNFTKNEIVYSLGTSDVKCIVTLPSLVPKVREGIKTMDTSMPIITVSYDEVRSEGTLDLDDMIRSNVDRPIKNASQAEDVALLLFSSGTTGLSKPVMLTHKNIVSNNLQLLTPPINHLKETTSQHQDVVPVVVPFCHIYVLSIMLFRGFFKGLHLVTLPKFDPQTYVQVISSQKPLTTVCYCNPPLLKFLGSDPLVKSEKLIPVRVIFYGTAPLGLSDIEKLLNKLPNPENVTFRNAYGLTETSPILFTPMAGNTELTSAGVPLPNTQVRIVSSSGKNLGPRENGEIYVKGPQVMKGYYKNDKSTAEAFENGWLKTGDIGHYDEKGRFYIVGRLKEMIKVDGYPVAPAELEAVLRSHPHVADVGVIGVPDKRTGEKPIAFVTPQPGSTIEINEIDDFVAQQVAPYKRLQEIIITNEIPRNPIGKIIRNNLREQYLSIKSS